ncbi:glucose-1-phosphate adenylyltransferase subunit GlgD [Lactiplantibacillus herbarum]|uniref:glucose-1-phosphate adenylyltransferase subunit GlgD n=1 Tax=Lactiplantibacillus herbarum TaxID=1670446 RepID=UPI00064F05FC|nr:glucose-1-phosphate adenylyltransferase subunit GlgD [Lactiplantibacillus herbarum]
MKRERVSAIINLLEPEDQLQPLTAVRPVGMLPFGGRYRLIDFQLSSIVNAGIQNVMVTVPRSGRSVADHLRSGSDWSLNTIRGGLFLSPYNDLKLVAPEKKLTLIYHYYDDSILFLKRSQSEYTVIMSTRNVSNIDLKALLRYHEERNRPVTVVYKRVARSDLTPENTVLQLTANDEATAVLPLNKLKAAPSTKQLAKSMSIYLLSTVDLIALLQEANQRGAMISLEQLLCQFVIQHTANAFEYTGYQANIHDIQSYFAANMSVLNETNFRALFYSSRRIYTKVKNEVPTFFTTGTRCQDSLFGTGGYIEGQVQHSVVFRNVAINQNTKVKDSVIMQGTRIGTGCQLENVVIDKNAVIGPNLSLKGTPEKPLVIRKGQQLFQQVEVAADD